jgi:hypothetical protein
VLSAELRKHARKPVLPAGNAVMACRVAKDEKRADSIHIAHHTKQCAIARVQHGLREARLA